MIPTELGTGGRCKKLLSLTASNEEGWEVMRWAEWASCRWYMATRSHDDHMVFAGSCYIPYHVPVIRHLVALQSESGIRRPVPSE